MEELAGELADARALTEQGEAEAALTKLDGVRRAALAAENLAVLEQVLQLAHTVREQADGKRRFQAGDLAYSARENIRFVGRKQALAEGRAWADPFPAMTPAAAAARAVG